MGTVLVPRDSAVPDDGLSHEDLGPLLDAVFWTLTTLAFIFLVLRLYCKYTRRRSLWWDDHFLIASWISLAVSAATTSVCVSLDYGKNVWDMDPENLPKMPFIAVFAGFFSVLAAAWSKTSFGLTLMRICHGWIRALVWLIVLSVNAILGTAMLFMWIKCRPVEKIWDDSVKGWCIDPIKIVILYQWSAGWSGSADVVLALVPWTVVLSMRQTLSIKERIGVAVAMSMGIVAGVASFVKMAMLPNLTGSAVDSVSVTIWGSAEGALTIMAASVPVLRAFFQKKSDRNEAKFDTTDERRLNNTTCLDTLPSGTNQSRISETHDYELQVQQLVEVDYTLSTLEVSTGELP